MKCNEVCGRGRSARKCIFTQSSLLSVMKKKLSVGLSLALLSLFVFASFSFAARARVLLNDKILAFYSLPFARFDGLTWHGRINKEASER